ncbi:MAG: hydroxyethylthiazole kinase [Succiniclasticum sp.]|jgi:hydroxyethylthiazole kinase
MNLKGDFKTIVEDLLATKPVIHHITNYVTARDCADAALAIGASPVMADELAEVADITSDADVLVLNLGTCNARTLESMELAAKTARENRIPVVLDPVGVMSSTLRRDFAVKLLTGGFVTVVRGNYSECSALLDPANPDNGGRGVDSGAAPDQAEAFRLVKDCADHYGCIFVLSGAVDYVSDGKRAVMLNGGNPLMTSITGAGCMATTVVAACTAVADDKMEGAILGMVIMGQAAELSAGLLEKKDGPGMFKVRLMDCLYHVVHKWSLIQDNLNPTREN